MADTAINESAQRDTAELLSENLRETTPVKSSPEQKEETMDETSATESGSKKNKMKDEEQQPLESSEKSSKHKDKSRSYRRRNDRSSSKSDDEEMEQHNKNSNKKDKSPTDRKTRRDGSNETPKKRLREDPSDTPRKRPRNGSKESSKEKSGEHSRDRSRRNSRSRSRNRSREDSSDTSRKRQRNRSKESSKERSGKHSDEKSGTLSRERREKSRDRYPSESKSPGKEKVNKSHGNNRSQSPQKSQETLNSIAVQKKPQTQKNKNINIKNYFPKVIPQKKEDDKKTRISPILFDKQNKTDNSRSWRKEDSLKLLNQHKSLDKKEHFCFFFGKDAPFSNFHPAQFTVDGVIYTCSEQFMMHQKAVMFQDWFHAGEILNAKVPLQMKKLGRKVQNFNPYVWGAECDKIMKRGLKAKFTENEHFKRALIDTFPCILVEASPRDLLWGIGLGAKNEKAHSRLTWRGRNKLGYLLTHIRNEIMEEEGFFH